MVTHRNGMMHMSTTSGTKEVALFKEREVVDRLSDTCWALYRDGMLDDWHFDLFDAPEEPEDNEDLSRLLTMIEDEMASREDIISERRRQMAEVTLQNDATVLMRYSVQAEQERAVVEALHRIHHALKAAIH